MNKVKLDEFLKADKKSDMSNTKKREFKNELLNALKETGLNEETINYIISCGQLGSALSFKLWLDLMSEGAAEEMYMNIVSSKKFRDNNNSAALRFEANLLGVIFTKDTRYMMIIEDIIKRLPSLARKKDGSFVSMAGKIIDTGLVAQTKIYTEFPEFDQIKVSDAAKRNFFKFMEITLSDIKYSNDEKSTILQKIKTWIREESSKQEVQCVISGENDGKNKFATDTNSVENRPVTDNNSEIKKNETENVYVQNINIETESTEAIKKGNKAYVLREIAQYIDCVEKERDRLVSELGDVKSEKNKLEALYKKSKERIEDLKKQNEDMQILIIENAKAIQDMQQKIDEQESKIMKRDSVLSIYSSDHENNQTEKLNAIASKLKGEYKDYLDSVDMDMTVELGLNLRDQLEDIFKILMKNGIDIKGR